MYSGWNTYLRHAHPNCVLFSATPLTARHYHRQLKRTPEINRHKTSVEPPDNTRRERETRRSKRAHTTTTTTTSAPPDQRQNRGGGVTSGALLPGNTEAHHTETELRPPDGRRRHSLPPPPRRRRRARSHPVQGAAARVVRRPVRGGLQGLRQPDVPGGQPAAHRRGALLGARRAVGRRQVLQDLLGVGLLRVRLRLRSLPVPRGPLRDRLLLLRRPGHVLLARPLRRRRRRAGPAQRLPRALRDLRLPPGLRRPDALQDLRLRRLRRRPRLRDAPRHRLQPARGRRRHQRGGLLRHQLPAGVRAGAVRGRPLQRRLQQLRHPGRAARRGRVRRRPLRPGLPRQVLHYLQLLPTRRAPRRRRRRPRRAADSQDCSHRAGWSLGPGFPGHLLALRQKPGQEEGRILTWGHGGRR